jgi:thioesterase domain-containing protein/acyl carrier protein
MSATSFIEMDDHGRGELERQLVSWWQEVLNVNQVRVDQDFFALGGNSILGTRLFAKIAEKYGFKLDILTLYDARTIAKLVDLIQLKQASAEHWCIVPMRIGGELPPLFLIHGVGGNVLGFFNLVKRLPSNQPVYGVQAQALQADGPTFVDLARMASYYIGEVRRVQRYGPYNFLGLSFGGLVAYEMAQQLRARGEEVRMLGMLDTWQPDYQRRVPNAGSVKARISSRLWVIRQHTRRLTFFNKLRYARNRFRSRVLRRFYQYAAMRGTTTLTDTIKSVRDINWVAGINYKVVPYDGRVTLFRAADDDRWGLPEDLGWRAMAREGVEIHRFPGDHGQVLAEPTVGLLAEKLTECLLKNNERIEIEL